MCCVSSSFLPADPIGGRTTLAIMIHKLHTGLPKGHRKQAPFRDPHKTLDNFDFTFNPKMNRSLVFDLATCTFIGKREDALFLGPGGTGKVTWLKPSAKLPSNRTIA